jgi:hypothetical protein
MPITGFELVTTSSIQHLAKGDHRDSWLRRKSGGNNSFSIGGHQAPLAGVGSTQKIKLIRLAPTVLIVQVNEQSSLTFNDRRDIARFLQLINLQSSAFAIGEGMRLLDLRH